MKMSFSKHQEVRGTKKFPKYSTPKPEFIIDPVVFNTGVFESSICAN